MGFGQRAAEHREVLREDIDHAAVDGAPAGDHTIAGDAVLVRPKIGVAMFDEHVELLKTVFVEQKLQPLPRGQLAALVLRVDPGLAAAKLCARAPFSQFCNNVGHGALPGFAGGQIGQERRRVKPGKPFAALIRG